MIEHRLGRAETNEKSDDIYIGETPATTEQIKTTLFENDSALCVPDSAQGLGETDVVGLELVQTDGSGQSEGAQEPVAERAELGHTPRAEVVGDGGPNNMSEDEIEHWMHGRLTGIRCGSGRPGGCRGRRP